MTLAGAQPTANYSYGKEKSFYFKPVEEFTGCCRQKDGHRRRCPVKMFSFLLTEHHAGRQHLGE